MFQLPEELGVVVMGTRRRDVPSGEGGFEHGFMTFRSLPLSKDSSTNLSSLLFFAQARASSKILLQLFQKKHRFFFLDSPFCPQKRTRDRVGEARESTSQPLYHKDVFSPVLGLQLRGQVRTNQFVRSGRKRSAGFLYSLFFLVLEVDRYRYEGCCYLSVCVA